MIQPLLTTINHQPVLLDSVRLIQHRYSTPPHHGHPHILCEDDIAALWHDLWHGNTDGPLMCKYSGFIEFNQNKEGILKTS